MTENKAFKIAGIRNLIVTNYKLPKDILNLNDLVDDELSMAENWNNGIKDMVFELLDVDFKYRIMGR